MIAEAKLKQVESLRSPVIIKALLIFALKYPELITDNLINEISQFDRKADKSEKEALYYLINSKSDPNLTEDNISESAIPEILTRLKEIGKSANSQ